MLFYKIKRIVLHTIQYLLLPLSILSLPVLVHLKGTQMPPYWLSFLAFYPYIVLGLGLILGISFNCSRVVFALIILALTEFILKNYVDAKTSSQATLIFHSLAVLLPWNILFYSLINERGILTIWGFSRNLLLALQVVIYFFIQHYYPELALKYLTYSLIKLPELPYITIAQPALLSFMLVFLLQCLHLIRHFMPIDRAFFWCLLATFLGFNITSLANLRILFFTSGGLILTIAVIETLHSKAFYDALTGLPSRRSLNEALLTLGSKYSIAMIDVDHFRNFNEKYGHEVGDQVLRMVATRIRSYSGRGKFFRYGGEEFTILYKGKKLEQVLPQLEKICQEVAEYAFVLRAINRPKRKPTRRKKTTNKNKKGINITISIGVAERSKKNPNPEAVIRAADKALYTAKKAGRNRVCKAN